MPEFFVLNQFAKNHETLWGTDFMKADDTRRGEALRCPICNRFTSSKQWLPPYEVELEAWGRGFADLAFGSGMELLASQRFRSLWEEHGLTGLSGFEPVRIVNIKRSSRAKGEPPRYYRAMVARTQTAIDQERSRMERDAPICPHCRLGGVLKRAQSIIIEEGTWTGEDIFVARGLPGTFITSLRFKDFCEKFNITNAALVPAESYSFDFYSWEKQTNGQ